MISLENESSLAADSDLRYFSFPIHDREVPGDDREFEVFLWQLSALLKQGRDVVVHCRQGIGRSGLTAACLLAGDGVDVDTAISIIEKARGASVPDTLEQRRWIRAYASGDRRRTLLPT